MAEISIEVAFATPDQQQVVRLSVPEGTTLAQAVERSGLAAMFGNFNLAELKKGVWNQVKPDDYQVQDGDRVEVYRPLIIDPKEARRRRATRASSQKNS